MRSLGSWVALGVLISLSTLGCATAPPAPPEAPPVPGRPRPPVPPAARRQFDEALAAMARHDAAADWSAPVCEATAALFLEAAAQAKGYPAPHYNAGLAYQRCKLHAKAAEQMKAALAMDPAQHRARAAAALYALEDAGEAGLDQAVAELERATRDSRFQNVEAMVNLAMVELRRKGARPDADGADDLERARKNLQRALAIDDAYMPAFNQLAVLHVEVARREAAKQKRRLDAQALELALLVCSQGIRKNPRYAPLHNTAGLIHAELGDLSRAVAAFNEARRLDPGSFESHMNAAAVNLQFRGFAEAERAYRDALRARPDDYDARLGLALALRGQIDAADPGKGFALAEEQLGLATKLSPRRPEAYFNAALLTMGHKAKATGADPRKALAEARRLFDDFIARAGSSPALAQRVTDARERMQEIDVLLRWHDENAGAAQAP